MDDVRSLHAMRRYWDGVTRGGPATPGELDPELASLIQQLHAIPGVPPDPSYARQLRENLMQATTAPLPLTLDPSLDGRAESSLPGGRFPALHPPRKTTWAWSQAIVALIVIVAILAAYVSFSRQNDRAVAPGVATPTADATPAADWPMYRGNPARTGVTPGPGPDGEPVEVWRFQAEGPASRSPAIAAGVAYLQSGDGHVYALEAATGKERWKIDLGSGENTPAIAGDTLYVNDGIGALVALDAANGAERWRFSPGVAAFATPVVVDGVLFTATDAGTLVALAADTGEEQWRYEADAGIGRSAAVAAGLVYLGTDNGALHVVDAATGTERWRFESGETTEPARTPTVADGVVYVNVGLTLYAFDAVDGEERWRTTFAGARPVTAAGDALYASGADGVIYALNAADGSVRWTFDVGMKNALAAAPALAVDTLYAVGSDRNLYALDAATGAERWSFALDGEVDNGPSVANGMLYVSTKLGSLFAIGGSGTDQLAAPTVSQGTPVPVAIAAGHVAATPAPAASSPWQTTGGPKALFAPSGGLVDASGNLWVVDCGNDQIQIIAPDGTFLEAWDGTPGGGEPFSFAKTNGGFDGDVAMGPDGRIYVAEPGSSSHRVQVFAPDRTWLATWDDFGMNDGQFVEPMSVAVDAEGFVYVLDLHQKRVQKFDADGNFVLAFGGDDPEEGELTDPAYLTIDREGNVLVPDWDHSRIVKFSSDGTVLATWGSFGNEPGEFRNPVDIVVDAMGNIYVADLENRRVQLLDPNGSALAAWGTGLTPDGQENLPFGLVLDGMGNLYVIGVAPDYDNGGNVQKFRVVPSLVPVDMATPQA